MFYKNKRTILTLIAVFALFLTLGAGLAYARPRGAEKGWAQNKKEAEHQGEAEAKFNETMAKRPNVAMNYVANTAINMMKSYAASSADIRSMTNHLYTLGLNKLLSMSANEWFEGSFNINLPPIGDFGSCNEAHTACKFVDLVKFGNEFYLIFNQFDSNGNRKACAGWGCLFGRWEKKGGEKVFVVYTPPPEWTPSPWPTPTPTPSPSPTPTPVAAQINSFEITNFRLQQTNAGVNYYQVLKEQMAIPHENYQLNLSWAVAGAQSCTGSCKYVKIDDYLANQNFNSLTAQTWPCDQNISSQATFAGEVNKQSGTAKTKPKEAGIIRYTLSCQGELGNDTAHLLVVIQDFRWFESIPILNSVASFLAVK